MYVFKKNVLTVGSKGINSIVCRPDCSQIFIDACLIVIAQSKSWPTLASVVAFFIDANVVTFSIIDETFIDIFASLENRRRGRYCAAATGLQMFVFIELVSRITGTNYPSKIDGASLFA